MNTLFPEFPLPCIRMTRIPGYKDKEAIQKKCGLELSLA